MNAKITFISVFIVLVLLITFIFNRNHSIPILTCSSKIHLSLNSQKDDVDIKGEVLLVFRIYSETNGIVSEVGSVNVNEKNYSINRTAMLKFIGQEPDGYLRTQRVSVVKNENDDLPDAITDLLMSKQTLFFYKIMPITSNIYGIRDLRRTLMVCRTD